MGIPYYAITELDLWFGHGCPIQSL